MGKTIIEKVASCNRNGELEIAPAIMENLLCEEIYGIDRMCRTIRGINRALSLAKFCREQGAERDAVDILHTVWRHIPNVAEISPLHKRSLRRRVYEEFSYLYWSPDEYVWEESSQFISSYLELKRMGAI